MVKSASRPDIEHFRPHFCDRAIFSLDVPSCSRAATEKGLHSVIVIDWRSGKDILISNVSVPEGVKYRSCEIVIFRSWTPVRHLGIPYSLARPQSTIAQADIVIHLQEARIN